MESNTHHQLVHIIINYLHSCADIENAFIEADTYDVDGNITRTIEGFIPDVFYNYKDIAIIGEAKTSKDLDRQHSLLQYQAYMNDLEKKAKERKRCTLILAVPWQDSISAYGILKTILKERKRIALIILNELGVFRVYEKD